jgi:hypothetical protein
MRARSCTIVALLVVLGLAGLAADAAAQPKPNVFDNGNRWLITYYNDCDPVHTQWATQGICFLPYQRCADCSITGAWYSDTFTDWNGRYFQEGDRVIMHGDYASNVGHDGMVIELFAGTSPRDEGAGQWTEWREAPGTFGTTIGFGNTRLRRVSKCALPAGTDLARLSAAEIDRLAADLSAKVKPRLRRDGKPAESPNDREQVPLPEERQFQTPNP